MESHDEGGYSPRKVSLGEIESHPQTGESRAWLWPGKENDRAAAVFVKQTNRE